MWHYALGVIAMLHLKAVYTPASAPDWSGAAPETRLCWFSSRSGLTAIFFFHPCPLPCKPFFCVAVNSRCLTPGFSSGALMTLSDDERHLLVSVVSVWLRRAGGDAGSHDADAYRQILSETEPAVSDCHARIS